MQPASSSPTRRLLFYSTPSSPRSDDLQPDFEFNISGHLDIPKLSAADELFHAGKILPLNQTPKRTNPKPQLGRGRAHDPNTRSGPRRGITRSLSPLRVSEFALLQQQQQQQQQQTNNSTSSRKWRLRDLLLFRSASEGSKTVVSESKRFSFRSEPGEGSSTRRAVTDQDSKKKTSLPYKYGLLGCLGFNLSSSSSGFREFSTSFGYSLSR